MAKDFVWGLPVGTPRAELDDQKINKKQGISSFWFNLSEKCEIVGNAAWYPSLREQFDQTAATNTLKFEEV